MGPKRDVKNVAVKRENGGKEASISLDDPINSDSWKCVVVMAVERNLQDSFLLKEFEEEAATQARPKIQLISYCGIVKIVNEFMRGEIRHKFAFLLNFSSVFQEVGECLTNKCEIPVELLVKIIKAMLLYLKEESMMKIETGARGPPDPIRQMAERPSTLGIVENKKKDAVKKGDVGLKVRPPSFTKQDTELLKRGEGVKENHFINDAPLDGFFNLYVLLIDFYSPELPLLLIKADVPLHGLICVDTSLSRNENETLIPRFKSASRIYDLKADNIPKFWNAFLRLLWDSDTSHNFKDIIFQVYTLRRLLCEKKERREFIYRELSYLMYDMSSYKQQLDDYLANLRLWDVEGKLLDVTDVKSTIKDLPNECVTVPIILQSMMDAICENDLPLSSDSNSDFDFSIDSAKEFEHSKVISPTLITKYGSFLLEPDFSRELLHRDVHFTDIYLKAKALDVYYDLNDVSTLNKNNASSTDSSGTSCRYLVQNCAPNLQQILKSSGSTLRSIRQRYHADVDTVELDYILYSILMTRVHCPYEVQLPRSTASYTSPKKNSNFELIEDTATEVRRPHFTVTDGSRHVLKSIPYNLKETSEDFFSPLGFKIVTPAKLKASSAPAFKIAPAVRVERSFMSDSLPRSAQLPRRKDLFLDLRDFTKDDVIASINDFNCLELLNKNKIINKEAELQSTYNCIDHTYSVLHDAVFVAMHNRTDNQNSQYETFNEVLRTGVGLRDFFNYVLQDEADWLKMHEKDLDSKTPGGKSSQSNSLTFSDSDFWMEDSIKYQFYRRGTGNSEKCLNLYPTSHSSTEKEMPTEEEEEKNYAFDGYDIGGGSMVQFSGMKTVFYSTNCSITTELIEKLYGDQLLGVHISQAGHTLHLYSYACPEPHIEKPFTFHLTCRSGIIVAFGGRFTETFDEIEEVVESRTTIRSKKNSSEISTRTVKKRISKTVADEEFRFDMKASLPNGLTIQVVTGMKPCYIRQRIISHPDEASRLFLPNGNIVKMMTNGTVQIFKMDTSYVTAELSEFVNDCSKYETVDADGLACVIENGIITSSTQFQLFRNKDLDTNRMFFRRRDGSSYLLQDDGVLCTKLKDNTKMCATPFIDEALSSISSVKSKTSAKTQNDVKEASPEDDYVIVHLEFTVEHPDYATTIYNTKTQKWRLLLPYDLEITVRPQGEYQVEMDKQTRLLVEGNGIETFRISPEEELLFHAVVDLSVFDGGKGVYVSAKDSTGKRFTVEANSNCYAHDDVPSEEFECDSQSKENQSTHIASVSLTDNGNVLSRENKYFVIKKDMSGFELLHEEIVAKALTDLKNGSVVFTQTLPDSDLRCFVLITPTDMKYTRKWEVKSILPEPKYVPHSSKRMSSTTYGNPPSWMHPFPKKRTRFQIPECLSCRVFLEVRPTGITPGPNVIDCSFCEAEEVTPNHTLLKRTTVDHHLRRLSKDNQDVLREMYTIIVTGAIRKAKNIPPSEKLAHYLKMSKYYVDMQEYHKNCIRYRKVPKYFHHPAGMSWLILNDLVDRLKLRHLEVVKFGKGTYLEPPPPSASDECSYSVSDVEYNLSIKTCQSFSSLSYHSSRSGRTAPGIIETQGVCKCKVRPVRNADSTPVVDYNWKEKSIQETETESESVSDSQMGEFPRRVCDFSDSDFDLFDTVSSDRDEGGSTLTLEDLMYLGLV